MIKLFYSIIKKLKSVKVLSGKNMFRIKVVRNRQKKKETSEKDRQNAEIKLFYDDVPIYSKACQYFQHHCR